MSVIGRRKKACRQYCMKPARNELLNIYNEKLKCYITLGIVDEAEAVKAICNLCRDTVPLSQNETLQSELFKTLNLVVL